MAKRYPEGQNITRNSSRIIGEDKLWKEKYIKENIFVPDYRNAAETAKLWEKTLFVRIMKEMNLIK
jgi:hypothetical protein